MTVVASNAASADRTFPVRKYEDGTIAIVSNHTQITGSRTAFRGDVWLSKINGGKGGYLIDTIKNTRKLNDTLVSIKAQLRPVGCVENNTKSALFNFTTNEYFNCTCKAGWFGQDCASDFSTCCGSKLVHWFDFSDTDEYGSTELAAMTKFMDKMGGASSMTINSNVQYKLNVQNGLNAIYANEQYASLQFSSKSGSNPEVFVAYRIVNNVGGRSLPHCFIFGGRAGYAFGSQWSGSTEPTYDAITVTDAAGFAMASLAAPFDAWHLADIYYGASDGFFKVDDGESESIAIAAKRPNNCGGCNGAYQDTELTNVAIGGFPWWPNIFCENYIGEVLIFDEKLTDEERATVTTQLMNKWVNNSTSS